MSETKKRTFNLELTDEDMKEFVKKCYQDGTTPAEVLEGFINDLVDGSRTRGSDERELASNYYDRCGYGFFTGEYCNFTQWLLNEYGEQSLKEIIDSQDDIKTFEEEIAYLKENPEQCEEGELEDLEAEMTESKEAIEGYYQEYAQCTRKPDSLEEGIKNVHEYFAMMKQIEEGAAI